MWTSLNLKSTKEQTYISSSWIKIHKEVALHTFWREQLASGIIPTEYLMTPHRKKGGSLYKRTDLLSQILFLSTVHTFPTCGFRWPFHFVYLKNFKWYLSKYYLSVCAYFWPCENWRKFTIKWKSASTFLFLTLTEIVLYVALSAPID